MREPSHKFDLHHNSQQHWIPNPLREARDQTCIRMETSQVHNPLSYNRNLNHIFYFLYSEALPSGAFMTLGGLSLSELANSKESKQLSRSFSSTIDQARAYTSLITSFIRLSCCGPLTTHLNRPRTTQPGTTPMLQSPLKLFKLTNPKPAHPALPIPSHGNQNKGSSPCFPLSLCLLTDHWCLPLACPLLWGTVSIKLSFPFFLPSYVEGFLPFLEV